MARLVRNTVKGSPVTGRIHRELSKSNQSHSVIRKGKEQSLTGIVAI